MNEGWIRWTIFVFYAAGVWIFHSVITSENDDDSSEFFQHSGQVDATSGDAMESGFSKVRSRRIRGTSQSSGSEMNLIIAEIREASGKIPQGTSDTFKRFASNCSPSELLALIDEVEYLPGSYSRYLFDRRQADFDTDPGWIDCLDEMLEKRLYGGSFVEEFVERTQWFDAENFEETMEKRPWLKTEALIGGLEGRIAEAKSVETIVSKYLKHLVTPEYRSAVVRKYFARIPADQLSDVVNWQLENGDSYTDYHLMRRLHRDGSNELSKFFVDRTLEQNDLKRARNLLDSMVDQNKSSRFLNEYKDRLEAADFYEDAILLSYPVLFREGEAVAKKFRAEISDPDKRAEVARLDAVMRELQD